MQGYLASIYFADTMLGHVLDALEKGPNAGNTIVALWSDHGWHLGEKQHWQKFTAWRVCTRVPLVLRVPKGASGLPAGTRPGVSDKPVSLLSLAPTLTELAGLPPHQHHHGPSLLPLLKNPKPIARTLPSRTWPSPAASASAPNASATSATPAAMRNSTTSAPTPTNGVTLAQEEQHAVTLRRLALWLRRNSPPLRNLRWTPCRP